MGLVLAIFCFIIGIPMLLGGLGLLATGYQQYSKVVSIDMDQWLKDAEQLNHDRCLEYYGPNGTVYNANPNLYHQPYNSTYTEQDEQVRQQEQCFDVYFNDAVKNKNAMIERNQNEGTGKMFGGSILALFAFLIMWGGNRSRRPKEVRIKSD